MRDDTAKPTFHNGIRYRSRTEARWAVFFDALGVAHKYELETIRLSTGESYLPDFWIEDFSVWFEVKPSDVAIVTQECVKARQLAQDRAGAKVWLAMGAPNSKRPNIIPLNQWEPNVTIAEILNAPENRYMILEDRRDEHVYWLYSEFVRGSFSHCYGIGGPGVPTDHDRLPMLIRRVAKAYTSVREAAFDDG